MVFSLSFAGVQVRITTSSSSNNDNFCIKSVRHCEDGHIEADVCNFSGTIIISAAEESKSSTSSSSTEENEQQITSTSRDMTIVNAIPEEISSSSSCQVIKWLGSNANGTATSNNNTTNNNNGYDRQSSFLTANSHTSTDPSAYVPQQQLFAHENSEQLTVDIDSEDDDEEKKMQTPEQPPQSSSNGGRVSFDLANTQVIQQMKPNVDLTLHKACASDEIEIDELRTILRMKPELASIQDEYGDYPAHIFANNDSCIYTSSDCEYIIAISPVSCSCVPFFRILFHFSLPSLFALIPILFFCR